MFTLRSLSLPRILFLVFILVFHSFNNPTDSGAVALTQDTIDQTLASNELVFINFYADWCRFSNLLMPIFDEASEKVKQQYPEQGKVVMGKVDCDQETSIASRFHISKYPTLKLIRNGQPAKKEYRGQRSADAFADFIRDQLVDPVHEFYSLAELQKFNKTDKGIVVGYFDRRDQSEYSIFRRVATNIKDECDFWAGFGDASLQMHPPGHPIVVFKPDSVRSSDKEETFNGSLQNFDELNVWLTEKCVPLVREITFENAEELTEEGLPFLILFYHPDHKETIKQFNEVVTRELLSEKQNMNFLTADGKKFAHPLHHLGKSEADLPLIAIDSFRHMYMFPRFTDIDKPNKLLHFIKDLYSGKLHREFHYGPDDPALKDDDEEDDTPTSPPESTFKKLAPSRNRYTILKDEL